jgi:tetratricopeptide (TPR) repeat protein
VMFQQGDLTAAQDIFAASLAHFQRAGDRWGQALAHCNLGRLAYRNAGFAEARSCYQRSLTLFEQIGDQWGQALAHCKLGWVAYQHGEPAAQAHFAESIRLFERVQYVEGIADALTGMAALALDAEQWKHSARLLGAAAQLRAGLGGLLHTTDDLDHQQRIGLLQSKLGEQEFAAAWDGGQAARVEQIIAEVRDAGDRSMAKGE